MKYNYFSFKDDVSKLDQIKSLLTPRIHSKFFSEQFTEDCLIVSIFKIIPDFKLGKNILFFLYFTCFLSTIKFKIDIQHNKIEIGK